MRSPSINTWNTKKWLVIFIFVSISFFILFASNALAIYLSESGFDLTQERMIGALITTLDSLAASIIVVILVTLVVDDRKREKEEEIRENILKEQTNKEEQIRHKIAESVFVYVFGMDIPKNVSEEIKQQIFKRPFIRDNYRVEYHLKKYNDNILECHTTIEYDVRNISDNDQEFEICFEMESRHHTPENPPRVSILSAGNKRIPHEDISYEDRKPGMRTASSFFDIKKGDQIKITCCFMSLKPKNHNDAIYSMYISNAIDFIIRFDNNIYLYQKASSLHPRPLIEIAGNEPQIHRYRLPGPILPYQGIKIEWSENTYKI